MVFLKIIACAFSMGFCLMCVSSLMGFVIGQIFDASSVWDEDPVEWLRQKCVYFAFLWIFFCGICAVLAAKLKDFGKLTVFFRQSVFADRSSFNFIAPYRHSDCYGVGVVRRRFGNQFIFLLCSS